MSRSRTPEAEVLRDVFRASLTAALDGQEGTEARLSALQRTGERLLQLVETGPVPEGQADGRDARAQRSFITDQLRVVLGDMYRELLHG